MPPSSAPSVRRPALPTLPVLSILLLASCGENGAGPQPLDQSLAAILDRARTAHGLPAVAGAVVRGDSLSEIAALGVRRLGASDSVRLGDRFHLGSNVKAMTADLIAMEVEGGRLAWDRTLAEIFPDWVDSMRAEYRGVTLEALLQHRGGFPAFDSAEDLLGAPTFPGTLAAQREALARWLLTLAPAQAAGAYLYSNAGYALAGAILERSAGESWEALLGDRLWSPLGITGGFGWPASGGAPQPWGHLDAGGGVLAPHDPDAGEQFPAPWRPTGDAHTSIGDYAAFACLHLRGLRGSARLLSESTFRRLHAPKGAYAMGWGATRVNGADASYHVGSAGTFAVVVMIQPDRDVAVAVATNAGSDDAIDAIQEAAIEALDR